MVQTYVRDSYHCLQIGLGCSIVNDELLCQKLGQYGVFFIDSFLVSVLLFNREQFCRVNDVDSKAKKINDWCPTRFMSWAYPFLIYINDLQLEI